MTILEPTCLFLKQHRFWKTPCFDTPAPGAHGGGSGGAPEDTGTIPEGLEAGQGGAQSSLLPGEG